ncbi:hypothetical protein FOL46_002169, partial [Perkinsus olseni]
MPSSPQGNDSTMNKEKGVEFVDSQDESTTRYEQWNLNDLNVIGSDLSRTRPRVPSAAVYILGNCLDYTWRYYKFSYDTYQYSPEAVARGVWWKDIAAWCDPSLGSAFHAESSVILRRLQTDYVLDVPLATFVFFYTLEFRCESKVKQQRGRDVLRAYLDSNESEATQFLLSLEKGEKCTLLGANALPSDDALADGSGSCRLVFTHHEGCTDGRSAPVNGSDDVLQKDTEEKTSEEDKEVEHLEGEEAEVVQDDLSEKTKAWGLLLRIAILYVGQCPSDGNNLREAKNDWLKVKQDKDKTFETYAAEERQAYEKMQVMYQWSGVECPTEYERIIKFMKGLNSGLADAYSKKLRKQDRRAEELTYRSM